eukprot:TRINITY_DN8380_c0_g1_i3.p1 TRINITY_DN8380_c0_g1~~TRINITY_DN8380_c0_g1_i3.p1  ORF type:complete len:119 (-),score=5.12 TRINITY_DN8380_c0_g1_i3:404-760(-)
MNRGVYMLVKALAATIDVISQPFKESCGRFAIHGWYKRLQTGKQRIVDLHETVVLQVAAPLAWQMRRAAAEMRRCLLALSCELMDASNTNLWVNESSVFPIQIGFTFTRMLVLLAGRV